MVELWSESVKLRYSNSRCSLAYLFTIVFYIVVILFPFYLGFSTHSFWKKHETLYIQPTITFENKFILTLEGRTGTQITWSSFPAYNGLLSPSLGRPVQISASSRDDNRDGIPDVYTITASVPLNPGEEINKASMYLFFRTELDDIVRLDMASVVPFIAESSLPGQQVSAFGDLLLHSKAPISSRGVRTVYATTPLLNEDILSLDDVSPILLHKAIASRNETLAFSSHIPVVWTTASTAMTAVPSDFTFTVDVRIPEQPVHYIPTMGEVLKFGWIQYLALFVLFYFFAEAFRSFVFRHALVDRYLANDMRHPLKAHQF